MILGRDAADGGLEVFMVRRPERLHLGSISVFPGGTVRGDDAQVVPTAEAGQVAALGALHARVAPEARVLATGAVLTCALRELFEEAGVLLAEGPGLGTLDQATVADTRQRLQVESLSLADAAREGGWTPRYEALLPFSHWITPIGRPVRFDTWFFVAAMPEAQEALHCAVETTEGAWLRPADVLRRAAEGSASIVFPTQQHLRRVAPCGSLAALLDLARTKPLITVQPELRPREHAEPVVWLDPALAGRW